MIIRGGLPLPVTRKSRAISAGIRPNLDYLELRRITCIQRALEYSVRFRSVRHLGRSFTPLKAAPESVSLDCSRRSAWEGERVN